MAFLFTFGPLQHCNNCHFLNGNIMQKRLLVIEKTCALLVTTWGVISLYSIVHTVWNIITTGYASSNNITYTDIIIDNHLNLLLSLAALYGGVALLFGSKEGWILSVITSLMFTISLFVSSRINAGNEVLPTAANFKGYGLLALIFLVILVMLLLQQIRSKYKPTNSQWKWMAIATVLLLLDKFIL